MVNVNPPRPTGGEYGEVRASIDQVKLNAYLAKSVPALTVPITIKQFKVRPLDSRHYRAVAELTLLSRSLVRSESSHSIRPMDQELNKCSLGSRIQHIS